MVANLQFGMNVLSDGSVLYLPYDEATDFSGKDPLPPSIDIYDIDTIQKLCFHVSISWMPFNGSFVLPS